MKLASLTVTALSLVSTLAAAQPGPGPDDGQPVDQVSAQAPLPAPAGAPAPLGYAEPPPQTVPWSQVSHINGQLVPVGSQNEYLKETVRKTNISVNPVGALFGFYGASASYALTNNIAVRADAEIFDTDGMKGTEFNVTLPIYLRKTYTGVFIEPGVMVRTLNDASYDDLGNKMSDNTTSAGPEVMIGYHYMTDSGFNMAAAIGAMRNINKSSSSEYESNDIDIQPAGYFRVGYAF